MKKLRKEEKISFKFVMSKQKIIAFSLFCIYVVIALIDRTIISFASLFVPAIGLVLIWIGEKITPIRLRAGTEIKSVTITGWIILLLPLRDPLFDILRKLLV